MQGLTALRQGTVDLKTIEHNCLNTKWFNID